FMKTTCHACATSPGHSSPAQPMAHQFLEGISIAIGHLQARQQVQVAGAPNRSGDTRASIFKARLPRNFYGGFGPKPIGICESGNSVPEGPLKLKLAVSNFPLLCDP